MTIEDVEFAEERRQRAEALPEGTPNRAAIINLWAREARMTRQCILMDQKYLAKVEEKHHARHGK